MGKTKFTMASFPAFITSHNEFTIAHLDWFLLFTTNILNCI